MRRLAVVLTILALWVVATAEPVGATGGLDEYRRSLEAAIAELERGGTAAEPVAARLRTIEPIDLADGSTIQPNLEPIVAALQARPPQIDRARDGLRAVLAELDRAERVDRAAGTARSGAPNDPEADLRRILAQPEFQTERRPDPLSQFVADQWAKLREPLDRAWAAVRGWLDSLLRRVPGDDGAEGILGPLAALVEALTARPLLAVLGLGLLAGLALLVIRGLRQAIGPGVVGAQPEAATAPVTADHRRAEADRLAQAGAFRPAIRTLYLAALLRWDEQGRLRFDRALTNREVLARAAAQGDPALIEHLTPLVERFDRFWYSGAPGSPDDYTAFRRLAGRAWEAP